MEDFIVRDTMSTELDGMKGRGFNISGEAEVELRRAIIERNRDVGVIAFDSGTSVTMNDVVVRETLERECVRDLCEGLGAGVGVSALGGAAIEMTRFTVSDNTLCGVQIAHGGYLDGTSEVPYDVAGTLDLHDGRIVDNPIGANVQAEDFDVERLRDNVVWDNHDFDIDTSEIYVPIASDPLE
jgi:hypothetical protein